MDHTLWCDDHNEVSRLNGNIVQHQSVDIHADRYMTIITTKLK